MNQLKGEHSTIKRRLIVTAPSDDTAYEQWNAEMKSNSTYKKLEKLCNLHGYTLFSAYNERYQSGSIMTEVIMHPNPDRGNWVQYLDDIYYDSRNNNFKAQTSAFGALTLENYSVFAEAVQHIQLLLEALNEIDLSTLYTWES